MTDVYEAREILKHIPCSALSYQDWVNVGAALHNEGLPCSLWDEWSASDSARYKSGECERKWKTFGHYGEKVVTMGTVYLNPSCLGNLVYVLPRQNDLFS